MERLLEILAEILNRAVASIADVTSEELASTEESLRSRVAELAEDPSDANLAAMAEFADAIDALRTETTTRTEAEAARTAQAAELLARVAPPPAVETPAEGPEQPAETPQAEAAPAASPADPPVDPPAETTTVATGDAPADAPAPIAAAAPATTRPRISAIASRRPVERGPRNREEAVSRWHAAAGDREVSAGMGFSTLQDVAMAIQRRNRAIGHGSGPEERIPVATLEIPYPEERTLGDNAERNAALIAAATSPEALVASGGYCAPVNVFYGLAQLAIGARPVRDSLAQFGATRGGIRFIRPPTFASFDSAVGEWTAATDATPAGATKGCLQVTCGSEVAVNLQAIYRCIRFGNMGARAFPEQVENALANAIAWHAREAERELFRGLRANSTAVTADPELVGSTRSLLATIDRAAAAVRARQRMGDTATLRAILPAFAHDQIRADLVRQHAGDNTYAVTDAQINAWFSTRNINVTWALDQRTAALEYSGAQAAGALNPWPDVMELYLFPEGSHLFLDGGTLDLGVVRDSTLNSVNDYQIFAETFEETAFTGMESLVITIDICPNGRAANLVDTSALCTSGS